ncbi:MAG: hypothetical protein R3B70_24725 [Polyangiaceae bacterium]
MTAPGVRQPFGRVITDGKGRYYLFCAHVTARHAVVCLDENLRLVPEFGDKGVAPVTFQSPHTRITSISARGDRVVLAGVIQDYTTEAMEVEAMVFAVLRRDGRMDTTFSGDGKLVLYEGTAFVSRCELDAHGGLLFTGTAKDKLLLARRMPDGKPDIAFAQDHYDHRMKAGMLLWDHFEQHDPTAQPSYIGSDLRLDKQGRIFVAGTVTSTR